MLGMDLFDVEMLACEAAVILMSGQELNSCHIHLTFPAKQASYAFQSFHQTNFQEVYSFFLIQNRSMNQPAYQQLIYCDAF